jgi:predicted cupin superfamily sugar epimerase
VRPAAEVVAQLRLAPHPEGGWYREVHRSPGRIETPRGSRATITSIYYLLEAGQRSRWHVVTSDEVWHFHDGAPLELLVYEPATTSISRRRLGRVSDGLESIAVVRAGEWQAARSTGAWSQVGCDVGPGFEFEDFQFVAALAGHELHFRRELAPFSDLL